MDKRQRRRLRELLADLDTGERNRLTKRAAKLRKAALRTTTGDERRPELQDFLLRLLDEQAERSAAGRRTAAPRGCRRPASTAAARGTVVAVSAGACVVQAGDDSLDAVLPADLARRQQSGLAVGDEVLLEPLGEGHRVTAVLPRRSLLDARRPARRARRSRAIAANVDIVVVVVAAKAPPLHPRLIDRYLVAVERSGARAGAGRQQGRPARRRRAARRARAPAAVPRARPAGAHVQRGGGEGIEELRARAGRRTCVFVGQSGVGKSSLLNALHAAAAAKTGAVRDGDGRGRHTTSASSLLRAARRHPRDRHAGHPPLQRRRRATRSRSPTGSPSSRRTRRGCRYRDCTHTHEPGCAVKAAVDDGAISRSRYESYRKLLAATATTRRGGRRRGA